MTLIRREGFVSALQEGILWYAATQQGHSHEAADLLAQRFADAVDLAIDKMVRHPESGTLWPHRPGYWFCLVRKPLDHWLIFYRQPTPTTIELVDLIRGERDLPKRVK